MKILSIADSPFHTLAYQNISSRRGVVTEHLPILRTNVDHLPGGLQAIMATTDLQVRGLGGEDDGPAPLLSELLAEELEALAKLGEIPAPDNHRRNPCGRPVLSARIGPPRRFRG